MTLKIISADSVLFEGEVSSVTLPGQMGAFTVLRNHASLISTLTAGKISYTTGTAADGRTEEQSIDGGIVDIDDNVISVCLY